jgi:hypothetical protein
MNSKFKPVLIIVGLSFFLLSSGNCGDESIIDDTINNSNNVNNINNIVNPNCIPGETECTNCIDDDEDGFIDGFDPECTGALDNDEGSFATGIPGDNNNEVWQDCFFDGNSGGGDDGCRIHTCCLLTECPQEIIDDYVLEECSVSEECVDNCQKYTPPGCDCFGCCTVCAQGECYDIFTNPLFAPDCRLDVISDPALCPPCVPSDDCGQPCEIVDCILCPGMTSEDLPYECNNNFECPGQQERCSPDVLCEQNYFCSLGCCIPVPY